MGGVGGHYLRHVLRPRQPVVSDQRCTANIDQAPYAVFRRRSVPRLGLRALRRLQPALLRHSRHGVLVLFVALVWDWTRRRPSLSGSVRAVSDLRMVGYYFFEQLEDVTKALISTMVCG